MKISKISLTILLICFLASKELLEEENIQQNIKIKDFNVNISTENCTIAIDSLKHLFRDGYIYTDIKKNPPNKDYFGAADIIKELENIPTINRTYYDFFRDMKRVLGKLRDNHIKFSATKFKKMEMCLPFSFHVGGENRTDAKIYIKKFDSCFKYFNQDVRDFVNAHEEMSLKSINGSDPFDYIQNINIEFDSYYNIHSAFTHYIDIAHNITISSNPLSQEQLSNISFIFDDGTNITLDYYLSYHPDDNDDKEFNNFYNQEIQKNYKAFDLSILDIEDKYYKIKNNLNNNDNSISWDYSTADGKIKCRADTSNELNVFV